ncbi:MAG: oxygenase MpaB family protein [Egibacteraceae bacterium]
MALSPVRLLTSAAPAGLPFSRTVLRALLGRLFGPPPFDPSADPGDPGLFGPGSASWKVISEPSSIIGGIRALVLQSLHPLAVAGVVEHSSFREDPLGRLHNTSAYVTAVTFGSTSEALAVTRAVRGAHRRVAGTAPDGRAYRADSPELLGFVSLALTSSFLACDRAYSPDPIDARTADVFVAEQARAAALLDPRVDLRALSRDPGALAALRRGTLPLPMLTDGSLPTTVAEMETVRERYRGALAAGEQSRDLLRFLFWPDLSPPLRGAYLPMLMGALATLDDYELRVLGAPPPVALAAPAARAQARALATALRLATGPSPAVAAATRRAQAA